MKIEVRTEGNVAVAVIIGEIDSKTAPDAQSQLMPVINNSGKLLMDMSGLTFLSSAGLRILLLLYRQAVAKNGKIVLVGLSEEIKDVMDMTGFLNYFVVADSFSEGLRVLG